MISVGHIVVRECTLMVMWCVCSTDMAVGGQEVIFEKGSGLVAAKTPRSTWLFICKLTMQTTSSGRRWYGVASSRPIAAQKLQASWAQTDLLEDLWCETQSSGPQQETTNNSTTVLLFNCSRDSAHQVCETTLSILYHLK